MSQTPNTAIAVIGIDIGKNSFHVVGHDARGAIHTPIRDFREGSVLSSRASGPCTSGPAQARHCGLKPPLRLLSPMAACPPLPSAG